MFHLAEYETRPKKLAHRLPWAALVAPGVVLNKMGSFQSTIQFRGPDLFSSTEEELDEALKILSSLDPVPVLVLQPVTNILPLDNRLHPSSVDNSTMIVPPSPINLIGFFDWARQRLPAVRLIPQMHPIWGMP